MPARSWVFFFSFLCIILHFSFLSLGLWVWLTGGGIERGRGGGWKKLEKDGECVVGWRGKVMVGGVVCSEDSEREMK